jgi:hypothetical protein
LLNHLRAFDDSFLQGRIDLADFAFRLLVFGNVSVCPGWVCTDMGGSGAPRSVEEGADTIVWLATEAP